MEVQQMIKTEIKTPFIKSIIKYLTWWCVPLIFNHSTETKANRSVSSRPPGLHSKFQVRQILSQKQINMPNQLLFLGAILSYVCCLMWILHTHIVKLINKNYAVLYLLLFFLFIYWIIIIYSIYYFYISYRVLTVFHSIF